MKPSSLPLASSLLFGTALAGCPAPAPDPTVPTDIFARMGDPMPAATTAQRATFQRGLDVARRRFTPEQGLGPVFNLVSCGNCHEKPVIGGGGGRYRNFLLTGQRLPDGSFTPTGTNGIQDQYSTTTGRHADAPQTNLAATRHSIPFFGAGLLAEVPDEEILSRADPDDRNHDGVSGRANYDRGYVGRFGRKAQTVSIEGFIRGPIFNHMGITSNPLSDALRAQLPVPSASRCGYTDGGVTVQCQVAAPDEPTVDNDGVRDPELPEQDLFDLVSFVMLTAAPTPEPLTAQTTLGKNLFSQVGCDTCHTPALRTRRGLIPAFSDLLVHDMGPSLADGVVMKEASGAEFRTQPLWGIGAMGHYLHDGRADSLEAAVLLHDGEGRGSRDRFAALTAPEQFAILEFMRSLGGRDQTSDGLVAPNTPIAEVGAYGGPGRALAAPEALRFLTGRALFDGDFGYAQGLGPRFNGDSCRACHFDPVTGGSGPSDVDVTRQGILDTVSGSVTAPAMGTMAHRHGSLDARPPIDPRANFFELRQTPPLFGLGLVEQIADDQILAHEDPMDLDHDGVRGRARRLDDGSLGRLGWKAGVPNLRAFARDALTNECGMTVPNEPPNAFGATTDGDAVPDPEISTTQLEDLTFFMASLAPPPRTRTQQAQEDAGEAVFSRVHCDTCHVPTLRTRDGRDARLYSDLLLHDVSVAGQWGIPDGPAGIHDFRTAPLWGLARTAPYMHDGRASTIEASIAAHGTEATASVTATTALNATDRAALLAFLASL